MGHIVPYHARQRSAQVGVDMETGQVFLYEILSAHDVAEILNRTSRDGHVYFALLSLSVRQQQRVCTNLLWFGLALGCTGSGCDVSDYMRDVK